MKRRAHSGTFFAVAACLLIALASGCRETEESPTAAQQKPSTSQSEGMKGITMQNLRVSDTRWVLSADSAAVFREKKRVEALPLHVDFYEDDRHVSTLTAKLGILLQASDDLEARGQVRVVNNDGTVLKTEVLFWDHQRSLIHTEAFVRIESGEDVLTGVGMEADPGLDRVDIKKSIRGTVQDAEDLLGEDEAAG